MKKIIHFIDRLGLDKKNFYTTKTLHNSNLTKDIEDKILKLNIDAVYLFDDNPTLLFKFSDNYNQQNIYESLLKSWNFDKAPILFYVTNTDILIYNTFVFPTKDNLQKNILGTSEHLEQYHLNKITNETFWESRKSIFQNKNRINQRLLKNIIDAKKVLKNQGLEEKYIHNIIGRSLFLRYIIDRNILSIESFGLKLNSIEDIFLNKSNLFKSFEIIKRYFNGDLFPVDEDEFKTVNKKHLETLHILFSGGEISSGQQSLFSYYDFSIIPIELVSNIYERFLHDGENSTQSHYTPSATVDLVLEQIFGTSKIKKNNIKIFDPSCGSGIFLVTFLKKYFTKDLDKLNHISIFKFIENSLFGIDVDADAINITIFSIYITVLEFFDNSFISKNNFKFPHLLNRNFFVGDFFNLEAEYNSKIIDIDFIVGNPPWGTIKQSLDLYTSYCNDRSLILQDKQIAQAFMYRVGDFMNINTTTALVLPSKIFYNNKESFRHTFLNIFDIKAVIEMSLERKKTFNKAIHPSAIVFYENKSSKQNIFNHLTLHPSIFYDLFKMFIFSEENIKTVNQEEIYKEDWMWKPLLYGSQLDIDFIKRIKSNFSTLDEYILKHQTNIGAGCIYLDSNKGTELPDEIYKNYKLLLTDEKNNTFYKNKIVLHNSKTINKTVKHNKFYDKGNLNSYKGPHLLIKRGVSSSGLTVGVQQENCIFRNSVFGIYHNNIDILNFLAALYNSDFYTYFSFMLSSSWGVERPEVLMAEHRQLPIPLNASNQLILKLSSEYIKLQKLTEETSELKNLFAINEEGISLQISKMNKIINKEVFKLSNLEIDLVNYGTTTYPQISENIINNNKASNNSIEQYINKFIHEISILKPNMKNTYIPNISINEEFIFMYFKDSGEEVKKIVWLEKFNANTKNLLDATFNLSLESITNDIAFRRKIFGIDGNSFYFIKSNKENIFHTLNARLDAQAYIKFRITK
ncbi:MAG: hypothetical protein WC279_09375 [Sulfurimonas sp.]|jgi:hypothetical protein|uniref:Eco57I restriction-modification methylase domain-containing protein n=1 Tax=Sulfurimonas sp. TaxID=2022749 RepID=UPI00356A4DFB